MTTPTNNPIMGALSDTLGTILKDADQDELKALGPVIVALGQGLKNNPDTLGLQLLTQQFATNLLAAQVTVKGLLLPQIGNLLIAAGTSS